MNELLGVFNLFRASRMRRLVGPPVELRNATAALRSQAAVSKAGSILLNAWPEHWHLMLDTLRARATPPADVATYRMVTRQEAVAPYVFLQRMAWSSSAEFPKELRKELEVWLGSRKIFVGPRRYYVDSGPENREREDHERLRFLLTTQPRERRAHADDRMSATAVQDLFNATNHQLSVLRKLGIVRAASSVSIHELDMAMRRLAKHARELRPTVDRDVIPLSDFSPDGGNEFETQLRNVLSGQTPSVYSGRVQIPCLSNLYVPSRCARDDGSQRHEECC